MGREKKVVSLIFGSVKPPEFLECLQGIPASIETLEKNVKDAIESIVSSE